MNIKSSKSTQSLLPKIGFHLERLNKKEIREAAKKYNGGNVSHLMNVAAEYYLLLRKTGDDRLERFMQSR